MTVLFVVGTVYLLKELFCPAQNRFHYTTNGTFHDCAIINCNSIDMETVLNF